LRPGDTRCPGEGRPRRLTGDIPVHRRLTRAHRRLDCRIKFGVLLVGASVSGRGGRECLPTCSPGTGASTGTPTRQRRRPKSASIALPATTASAAPSRSDRTNSVTEAVVSNTEADLGQPERKLSRTFRSELSMFVSTSTTLCQVPSSGWPPNTGNVSDGDMKAGST
jgi:hypothetical protein